MRDYTDQIDSAGASMQEIVDTALAAAAPRSHLRWLDIGCGRGDLLRKLRDEWQPASLSGIDPIDWLDDDLRADVDFHRLAAEDADELAPADRVLLIEVIEHLEAPWSALRSAARLVAPGGRLVVSTPNLATLRTRLELGLRGNLTSFRPDYEPHISPALPHVTNRILREEGLTVQAPRFAGADVISLTNGRVWPERIRSRWPSLTSVSVVIAANRDGGSAALA
ncbi:MAG TPA: class I SAM-dependent methyltransferase [Solirubrobacteraceae bacterium]|jgi:2-polyprenyl-3-methyl-5-hydroxy-6-metoxy-1,4-benzoquinol methylase|nr:class I SAM-dependent methyltransferase [Solirubrobacteraceae bacterium]